MPNLIDVARPVALEDTIEIYLKRSGLLGIIPQHRQQTLLSTPVAVLYLAVVWLIGVLLTGMHDDGLSVVVIPSVIAGSGLMGFILYWAVRAIVRKETPSASSAGSFFMVTYPLLMALSTAAWARSPRAGSPA